VKGQRGQVLGPDDADLPADSELPVSILTASDVSGTSALKELSIWPELPVKSEELISVSGDSVLTRGPVL